MGCFLDKRVLLNGLSCCILKMMTDYILKTPEFSNNNALDVYEGLNEAQAQAVAYETGPLLVIAGAGSGKTKTIVHRVARLVQDGVPAALRPAHSHLP